MVPLITLDKEREKVDPHSSMSSVSNNLPCILKNHAPQPAVYPVNTIRGLFSRLKDLLPEGCARIILYEYVFILIAYYCIQQYCILI